MHIYQDYYWNEGKPVGIFPLSAPYEGLGYRIVADPYQKRISIEEYADGAYRETIYDSYLFDFRHLRPEFQVAWQKILCEEGEERSVWLIRNQDDRAVILETYLFEGHLCRSCHSHTPQGISISTQKMSYTLLGDAWDGVTLYDRRERPVLEKKYRADPKTGEFTELIADSWNMRVHAQSTS